MKQGNVLLGDLVWSLRTEQEDAVTEQITEKISRVEFSFYYKLGCRYSYIIAALNY